MIHLMIIRTRKVKLLSAIVTDSPTLMGDLPTIEVISPVTGISCSSEPAVCSSLGMLHIQTSVCKVCKTIYKFNS